MLSKSVLPLPDKFHGLKDTEKRYRQVGRVKLGAGLGLEFSLGLEFDLPILRQFFVSIKIEILVVARDLTNNIRWWHQFVRTLTITGLGG